MVKVGLAVIHGIGSQRRDYAAEFLGLVRHAFDRALRGSARRRARREGPPLVTKAMVLSGVLKTRERLFISDLRKERRLDWDLLRSFVADYLGDAIAYQRDERGDVYARTHALVAEGLNELNAEAGPGSTVAIAAHSLGTIVASNFIYDVEEGIAPEEVKPLLATRASRLESFTHLWTFGSPLALWSLRYPGFGRPIRFPVSAPEGIEPPEWVNFLDTDDIIAWPLKPLSGDWSVAVTRDEEVQAGGWLTRWNPFSHAAYWGCRRLAWEIGRRLARDWAALNG